MGSHALSSIHCSDVIIPFDKIDRLEVKTHDDDKVLLATIDPLTNRANLLRFQVKSFVADEYVKELIFIKCFDLRKQRAVIFPLRLVRQFYQLEDDNENYTYVLIGDQWSSRFLYLGSFRGPLSLWKSISFGLEYMIKIVDSDDNELTDLTHVKLAEPVDNSETDRLAHLLNSCAK